MKQNGKILLATDYSETATNAARFAIQFAKRTNSSVIITHVYEIPFGFPSSPAEYAKAAEELRSHKLQQLQLHTEELYKQLGSEYSDVSYDCTVLEGFVGRQIRKEAETLHSDFVLAGTHGATAFHELFMGSHTWDIVKNSAVPVFAIPGEAVYKNIKKIVFAAEYRDGEVPGIHFAAQLAQMFNADLTILHISRYVFSKELEQVLTENFVKEIGKTSSSEKINLRIQYHDDIIEGINDFCQTQKVDLLVMSHSRTSVFEKLIAPGRSISKQMSFHTHTPLLFVPDFYTVSNEYQRTGFEM